MIAYIRGSKCLSGAASLRNRMPAAGGVFQIPHISGYSSVVEHQPDTLTVAGSNPAV